MPHYKVATGGFLGSPILGFPSIYAYTLCLKTTKFDVVTHVREMVYLGVSHVSHHKCAEFQGSPSFGVLLYLSNTV